MPKLTQITKINRDGGPGYRLTGVQDSIYIDQEDLDRYQTLKLCVATPYGLIPSPYTLEPKQHSGQGHNIVKGVHPDFKSLFEFIVHYTFRRVHRLERFNALKKSLDLDLKIIPIKFWRDRAFLAIVPFGQDDPDFTPLTCIRQFITPAYRDSLHHLYDQDPKGFKALVVGMSAQLRNVVSGERDIYTLDFYLRSLGIELQHYRVGIDSPNATVAFFKGKKTKIIHLPMELKTHSKNFYADAKSKKGLNKYWQHMPASVVCIRHNSKDWKLDTGIGVISIEDLIRHAASIAKVRVRLPSAA